MSEKLETEKEMDKLREGLFQKMVEFRKVRRLSVDLRVISDHLEEALLRLDYARWHAEGHREVVSEAMNRARDFHVAKLAGFGGTIEELVRGSWRADSGVVEGLARRSEGEGLKFTQGEAEGVGSGFGWEWCRSESGERTS